MRQKLAFLAILLGIFGVLPLVLDVGFLPQLRAQLWHQLGLLPAEYLGFYSSSMYSSSMRYVREVDLDLLFAFVIAPTSFLWGLVHIQRTSRARILVLGWAAIICVFTIPFIVGLILCIPLFVCGFIPLLRRFKDGDGAFPPGRA